MTIRDFKITIHMASSIDGYVAKKDQDISWFETSSPYENGVESEDTEAFLKSIDCYVMGANTYELANELSKEHGWAYGDKPTYVFTHRILQTHRPNITFCSGDLTQFVNQELKPKYKHVWMAGGSELAREFIRLKLADEIRISLLPILLGSGLPYFDLLGIEMALHLKDCLAYKNGLVELCYEIPK